MKTYYRRKALGICTTCGKQKAMDGKIRCLDCHKAQLIENRETYHFYVKNRVCPICRKEPLFENEKSCLECNAKRLNNNDAYRNRDRKHYNLLCAGYRKKYKAEREEKGLCNRCGKRKAEVGRKTCEVCKIKRREQQRKDRERKGIKTDRSEWVSNGLCYFCGNPIDRNGRSCKKCAEKMTSNLPPDRGGGKHWENQNKLLFQKGKRHEEVR